jgi:hypothetical protein
MGEQDPTPPTKLWTHPAPETTQMWLFKLMVEDKYKVKLSNYQELYNWSIENIADFWREVALFTGLHASARKEEQQGAKRRKLDPEESGANDSHKGTSNEEIFNEVSGRFPLCGTRDYVLPTAFSLHELKSDIFHLYKCRFSFSVVPIISYTLRYISTFSGGSVRHMYLCNIKPNSILAELTYCLPHTIFVSKKFP